MDTSKPSGETLSPPGPPKMSDLDSSINEVQRLPPRRLEPIANPAVSKKRKRTRKKERPLTTTEDENTAPSTSQRISAIDEQMLIQLRSRLDPIYNPPPQDSSLPPARLPPLSQPESDEPPLIPSLTAKERGSGEASHSESKPQKGTHRRTSQNRKRASDGEPGEKVILQEQVGEQLSELKSTSKDALIVEPPPASERKRNRRGEGKRKSRRRAAERDESRGETAADVEESQERRDRGLDSSVDNGLPPAQSEDEGQQLQGGRQLPALPDDGEDMRESTMADELATTGGIPLPRREFVHPDDPQFLVAAEDVVEIDPTELQTTTRLFQPVLQPHPSSSEPKEVIFVERKDGRGFIAQKKDSSANVTEVERGLFSGEKDISSSEFAIYSHNAVQHVAFIAHGLVAGISLWDCVVSNILSRGNSSRHLDLLTFYHPLTLPVNAIYVLLLSLVVLSLLDRFDFASLNKQCLHNFFKTPVQIVLLITSSLVFVALTLTLSVAAIDERISLYPHQPSLWVDVLIPINTSAMPMPATPLPTTHTVNSLSLIYIPGENLVSSRVTPWLALAIARGICCCISWMLVVWISTYDRLLEYLKDADNQTFKC